MILKRVEKRIFANFEWQILVLMLLLCAVGLGVLYSAGYDQEIGHSETMKRQAVSMAIGLSGFLVCMLLNASFWKRIAFFVYFLGIVLLVLLETHGVIAGGARRWLNFGGFRMQPSEFMKLGVILTLARICSQNQSTRGGYNFVQLLLPLGITLLPVAMIAVEPDLGTALALLLVGASMVLFAGVRPATLIRLSIIGLLLCVPAWGKLKDYQRQRIVSFLSPEQDPQGTGYHANQSKIAVGSGYIFGKGFLKGTQTQLRFLPEQTTDFIFSVLAEEWGFIGSLTTLMLYLFLISRLMRISSRCSEPFSAFVAFGVSSLVFWHVVINIGMVSGIAPVVGITLPLLSYGGSSVVTVMASLGIVAGISVRRFLFA